MEFELTPDCIHGQRHGRRLLARPQESDAPLLNTATATLTQDSDQPHSGAIGNELARTPPEMPVPLITIGKVYAPIPAGKLSVHPEAMAAARQLGLAPMLAAAIGSVDDPHHFWDVASLTDPITASSLQQTCTIGGKRVLFVERGAAEGLAKGTVRLEEKLVKKDGKSTAGRNDGGTALIGRVLHAVNPIRVVDAVWTALRRDAALRHDIKRRKNGDIDDEFSISQSKTFQLKKVPPGAEDQKTGPTALHAHLAHVPVRLALALLRGMPRQFALLAGCGNLADNKDGISSIGSKRSSLNKDTTKKKDSRPNKNNTLISSGSALFSAADSLDDVVVHTLKGLSVVQNSKHGSMHFTPAFLSETVLHSLWHEVKAAYGAYVLTSREVERLMLCRRLVQAAAMVAGGPPSAAGGVGGGGSSMFRPDDSDEEAMEEPPEVQELMRELGAGGMDGFVGGDGGFDGNGGTQSPNALVRWGASFACGVVILVGPAVNAAGALLDNALMALPGGPKLLGINIPELEVESQSLPTFLNDIKVYNSLHAASRASPTGEPCSEESPSPPSPSPGTNEAAFALASQALWMAVAAKMVTGNEKGVVSLHFPPHLDSQDPAAIAAVILRRYLPLLEFNGFSHVCPQWSKGSSNSSLPEAVTAALSDQISPEITYDDVEAARKMLLNKESAALGIHVELRGVDAHGASLPAFRGLAFGGGAPGVSHPTIPPSPSSGDGAVEAEPFGKGVILIGDPDLQPRSRTWRRVGKQRRGRGRGVVFGGMGMCVGVDDGRRLL